MMTKINKVNMTRDTINISVSVRLDQYVWLNKQKKADKNFNKSKIYQDAVDKKMVKSGSKKKGKASTNRK